MASVNFEKLKTSQEVKAMLRHCDKEERMTTNHGNKDINKALTSKNEQFDDMSYQDSCNLYDERIRQLDSLEGANKRNDRVTCFGLGIPAPAEISEDDEHDWFGNVYDIISNQYGDDNIIAVYVHYDEKHSYTDAETGLERTSRAHMHVYVIPEINGKLNGKQFSSKKNMMKLNNRIQKMTQDCYEMDFMDGTKRKSKAEVETLKNKSKQKEIEKLESDLKARQEQLDRREKELRYLQQVAENKREEYLDKIEKLPEKAQKAIKFYDTAMARRATGQSTYERLKYETQRQKDNQIQK